MQSSAKADWAILKIWAIFSLFLSFQYNWQKINVIYENFPMNDGPQVATALPNELQPQKLIIKDVSFYVNKAYCKTHHEFLNS